MAEAAGAIGSKSDGLYNLSGVSYEITDTVTNMLTSLSGIDAAALTGASALNASDTTAMTVANATTLTSLPNWVGHDHDGDATTAARYYIEDGFAAVQAADATLINNAATVVANGTANGGTTADNMNMSMHSVGLTINGLDGDDVITGTSAVDTINGSTGADTIDGGSGDDVIDLGGSDTAADVVVFGHGMAITSTDAIITPRQGPTT